MSSIASSSTTDRPMWIEVFDPRTQRPYWYHRQTRETTWKNPLPPPAPAPTPAAPSTGVSLVGGGPLLSPFLRPARNPYGAFSRDWIVPGTVCGVIAGGFVGAGLSSWYFRDMWKSSVNVGLKFGARSFLYFTNLAVLSDVIPDQHVEQRLLTHAASGAASGAMLGGMTNRLPGVIRGGGIGAVMAVPIWFLLEGRYKVPSIWGSKTNESKVAAK